MNTPALEDRLEANRNTVVDFYEKALNQADFEAAAVHFGPLYVQHNPMLQDGVEGFRAFLARVQRLSDDTPSVQQTTRPKRDQTGR